MTISRNQLPLTDDQERVRVPHNGRNRGSESARSATGVLDSERGSVTVEYAVLLAVVSLGCMFAIVSLGVPLVRIYQTSQAWLMLPIP